ncbi:GT2 family glycosyltransferase [Paenibacillus shirakamiensis]|uniref:GT2 family glycosyltransferase n=1 Tax=Paenibacillus shirakamiensis TaxID=1265935 RepID=A0ABS4JK99_9BACL|nr:glycosyltransferase family 2 protein [Paenibacillus shirakamiensis]MBP2002129.1 GT2 family glycosyltransferase [Paenibacillus shirakamiensis]
MPIGRSRVRKPLPREEAIDRYKNGYQAGYEQGKIMGLADYTQPFEGTSIIIPTYNGEQLLLECLDSIQAYTSLPYEIIVVDNASTDGTVSALQKRGGGIRIGRHAENLGFARAVNTGLMMAKGSQVLLLNNDTLVTEHWLDHMLICLYSEPDIGAVGPVTNYIGGEQQIPVPYQVIDEMWDFAKLYNSQSDPARWVKTNRLAGFCLLLKRSIWEHTGYLDEGYRIGNYEDDDYMLRLRFQGLKLIIAKDVFIHHVGSATMRTLGSEGYEQVNGRNEHFFQQKWGNVHATLSEMQEGGALQHRTLRAFNPTHLVVKDMKDRYYWLERGTKYPLQDPLSAALHFKDVPLLSMVDLRGLSIGDSLQVEDVLSRQWLLYQGDLDAPTEGALYRNDAGQYVQISGGACRPFLTTYALNSWHLEPFIRLDQPAFLKELPPGLVILAAPVLGAADL